MNDPSYVLSGANRLQTAFSLRQVSKVCTSCGAVLESCDFQSAGGDDGASYVPPTETTKLALCPGGLRLVRTRPLRGHRLECDRWLQHAAGRFAMSASMTQRARDLYQVGLCANAVAGMLL